MLLILHANSSSVLCVNVAGENPAVGEHVDEHVDEHVADRVSVDNEDDENKTRSLQLETQSGPGTSESEGRCQNSPTFPYWQGRICSLEAAQLATRCSI